MAWWLHRPVDRIDVADAPYVVGAQAPSRRRVGLRIHDRLPSWVVRRQRHAARNRLPFVVDEMALAALVLLVGERGIATLEIADMAEPHRVAELVGEHVVQVGDPLRAGTLRALRAVGREGPVARVEADVCFVDAAYVWGRWPGRLCAGDRERALRVCPGIDESNHPAVVDRTHVQPVARLGRRNLEVAARARAFVPPRDRRGDRLRELRSAHVGPAFGVGLEHDATVRPLERRGAIRGHTTHVGARRHGRHQKQRENDANRHSGASHSLALADDQREGLSAGAACEGDSYGLA